MYRYSLQIILLLDIHVVCMTWCVSGVTKKMEALAKRKKGFSLAGKWIKSVNNHVYYCAGTSGGNGDLSLAKWDSLVNHLQNIHVGHSSALHPVCLHGPLGPEEQKEWFTPGKLVCDLQQLTLYHVIISLKFPNDNDAINLK